MKFIKNEAEKIMFFKDFFDFKDYNFTYSLFYVEKKVKGFICSTNRKHWWDLKTLLRYEFYSLKILSLYNLLIISINIVLDFMCNLYQNMFWFLDKDVSFGFRGFIYVCQEREPKCKVQIGLRYFRGKAKKYYYGKEETLWG